MHRMAVRPVAFMGRAISITASSWVWAPGRIGGMAMAGVVIASAVVAAEGTSPAVETVADVLMLPIVDVARRQRAVAAAAAESTPQPRVAALLTVRPMPHLRVEAPPMVRPMPQPLTVADHMAAEDHTAVANIASPASC
jgi:hypothetical protein